MSGFNTGSIGGPNSFGRNYQTIAQKGKDQRVDTETSLPPLEQLITEAFEYELASAPLSTREVQPISTSKEQLSKAKEVIVREMLKETLSDEVAVQIKLDKALREKIKSVDTETFAKGREQDKEYREFYTKELRGKTKASLNPSVVAKVKKNRTVKKIGEKPSFQEHGPQDGQVKEFVRQYSKLIVAANALNKDPSIKSLSSEIEDLKAQVDKADRERSNIASEIQELNTIILEINKLKNEGKGDAAIKLLVNEISRLGVNPNTKLEHKKLELYNKNKEVASFQRRYDELIKHSLETNPKFQEFVRLSNAIDLECATFLSLFDDREFQEEENVENSSSPRSENSPSPRSEIRQFLNDFENDFEKSFQIDPSEQEQFDRLLESEVQAYKEMEHGSDEHLKVVDFINLQKDLARKETPKDRSDPSYSKIVRAKYLVKMLENEKDTQLRSGEIARRVDMLCRSDYEVFVNLNLGPKDFVDFASGAIPIPQELTRKTYPYAEFQQQILGPQGAFTKAMDKFLKQDAMDHNSAEIKEQALQLESEAKVHLSYLEEQLEAAQSVAMNNQNLITTLQIDGFSDEQLKKITDQQPALEKAANDLRTQCEILQKQIKHLKGCQKDSWAYQEISMNALRGIQKEQAEVQVKTEQAALKEPEKTTKEAVRKSQIKLEPTPAPKETSTWNSFWAWFGRLFG